LVDSRAMIGECLKNTATSAEASRIVWRTEAYGPPSWGYG